MKKVLFACVLATSALWVGGCSSADSTADAPPKGAEPEVKQADPSMPSPEERAKRASKPSEGPDGGI